MSKELAKKDDSLFLFHPDKANEIKYYEDEIKKLNLYIETLKNVKLKYEQDLKDMKVRLDTLKFYENIYKLECICESNMKITILKCSRLIEEKLCKIYDKCPSRNKTLKSLHLNNKKK